MNKFENPGSGKENQSKMSGIGKAFRKAFYGTMAGAMLTSSALGADGKTELKSPIKDGQKTTETDTQRERRRENELEIAGALHAMLQEISTNRMQFFKDTFVIQLSDGTGPSKNFKLEKDHMEIMLNLVEGEFFKKKTSDEASNSSLWKSTSESLKKEIEKLGKPISENDPALEGIGKKTLGDTYTPEVKK